MNQIARTKKGIFLCLIGLMIVILAARRPSSASEALPSPQFDDGMTTVTLTHIPFEAAADGFITSPLDAPFDFNVVVPQWLAVGGEEIFFDIRTGRDGVWQPWTPVLHSEDLKNPGDLLEIGDIIAVPAADRTHNQVQLRASTALQLAELRLTFIDSSEGPTTADLLATQAALDAAQGLDLQTPTANPKPPVISRAVWCTDDGCACPPEGCGNSCLDSDPLKYRLVSHMIVHHTVSSNSSADWAAVMRAIWRFHALSGGRCWGDIGYNYLIDMNGVIYEGHRGGDDVIGTHAAGGNKGSMGVSLIGTFTWPAEYSVGIAPPQPMRDSLVDLLAWKADHRQIDVYDSGKMPDLYGGRTNIMGHRDVYGTTTCPGGQAHAMLPEIRDLVAQRLNWLDTNWFYIDELDNQVTRSSSNWRTPTYQCGYNTHSTYTWSTSDQNASPYWHEWAFDVPSNGVYKVQVFVPYCNTGTDETNSARYIVHHANGSDTVTVDQEHRVGLWTTLGQYELSVNSNHRLRLTDITSDDGLGVWFDTIRLQPVTVTTGHVNLVSPNQTAETADRTVTFRWTTEAVSNSTGLRFEAATDAAMSKIVHSQDLSGGATTHTHTFGADYASLYWRVVVTGDPEIYSAVREIMVDTTGPQIGSTKIYQMPDGRYRVETTVDDALSGVGTISLEVREVSTTEWQAADSSTSVPAFLFNPPDDSKNYQFRFKAADQLGNLTTGPVDPEATTDQAIVLDKQVYFPIVFK